MPTERYCELCQDMVIRTDNNECENCGSIILDDPPEETVDWHAKSLLKDKQILEVEAESREWEAKYDALEQEVIKLQQLKIETDDINYDLKEQLKEWEAKYTTLATENTKLRACIIMMLLDKYGGASR